jgi:hypothetical protein
MLIQDFLRTTVDGIGELKRQFAIDAKRHQDYPNLVQFKYSQIDSPMANPLIQEARGIILDEKEDWKVVCYTFKKFFNYGETNAAPINWLNAHVTEKLDGSLCQLYFYDDRWHVATSGTPDASGEVNDYGKTFKELFWETWETSCWNGKQRFLSSRECYAFELCTPFNRVVVDHKGSSITLIGQRNLDTLQEQWVGYKPGAVKVFPLYCMSACIKAAEALSPMKQEGFVVVDNNFNRIKVKSPAYLMLHHAKDSLSRKKMCEVIRKGEYEEFKQAIETLPELKKIFDEIDAKHRACRDSTEIVYDIIKGIGDQKEFALKATATPWPSVLFQMRKTGQSAAQILASDRVSIDAYMRMIGEK